MRRTPLNRGDKPLKTTKGLPRSGRIRPIGHKKMKEIEIVGQWRKDYLARHPFCLVWWTFTCTRRATMLHERYTRARSGRIEDLMSPVNVVPVCFTCHRLIHDNPAEATERGWLLTSQAEDDTMPDME
jgi:hypothetical protein